MAPPG